MTQKTNEKIMYFAINTILLLSSLILLIFIFIIVKDTKMNIAENYNDNINNVFFEIDIQQNTETKYNEKENIELPPVYIAENRQGDNKENNTIVTNNNEYDFNKINNNRYFYNQLSYNARLIYDVIEDNLNNMKNGKYKIVLPTEVSNILRNSDGTEILDRDFQSAWDALCFDRVDTFFIEISKIRLQIMKTTQGQYSSYELTITPSDGQNYLKNNLDDINSVNKVLNQSRDVRDNIINKVAGNDYNKVLQVHDWLIENLEYSLEPGNENIYNLYGALLENKAVCQGYAEAFKYILDEMGIPCIVVSGTATNSEGQTENHAWNYVQIYGNWYAVDVTWDDPIVKGGGYITNAKKHEYFLLGESDINKDHFPNGQLTQSGQKFEYPQLSYNSY